MSAQFPYNPDSNSDNLVGIDDLMDLLPLYGGEFFVDSTPTINYFVTDCCNYGYYPSGNYYDIYDTLYVSNESQFLIITGEGGVGTGTGSDAILILPDGDEFMRLTLYNEDGGYIFLPNPEYISTGSTDIWIQMGQYSMKTFYRLPTGDWIVHD